MGYRVTHGQKSEAAKSTPIDNTDTPLLLSSSLFVSLSVSVIPHPLSLCLFSWVDLCVFVSKNVWKGKAAFVNYALKLWNGLSLDFGEANVIQSTSSKENISFFQPLTRSCTCLHSCAFIISIAFFLFCLHALKKKKILMFHKICYYNYKFLFLFVCMWTAFLVWKVLNK